MEHSEGGSMSSIAATGSSQNPSGGENMPNNSFSSKGLADFKPGIDHTKPMVDIHHGKENQGMFKNPSEFHSQKNMIDISKPVVLDNTKPHETQPVDKPKQNPLIDLNKGQKPSLFKDMHSVEKKGMIDISKPYEKEWLVPHDTVDIKNHSDVRLTKNDNDEKVNKVLVDSDEGLPNTNKEHNIPEFKHHENGELESIFNHQKNGQEEQHKSFKTENISFDTVQKSEKTTLQKNPRPEGEKPHAQELPMPITVTHSEEHINTYPVSIPQEPEVSPVLQTKPEVRTDISQLTKTEEFVKEQILEKAATQKEISALQKESVEYAPELATTEKISLEKAREAMEEIIVSAKVSENLIGAPIKKSEKKIEKKLSLEKKAKALFLKRKAEKMELKKEKKDEEGILFFEKDKGVNIFRQMAARLSYEKLSSRGKNVTGSMLAKEVSAQILQGKKSEIVDGVQDDRSAVEVVSSLSKVGTIENSTSLNNVMKNITDHQTAVKLVKESNDGALKENAEKVYGIAGLDDVGAKYEEEHSYGKIQELQNGQVVYITQRKSSSPVVDGEMSSE